MQRARKHEATARREDGRHATEEVGFAGAVEVVDGERGDHEVERAVGEGILEAGDPEIGIGQRAARVVEHVGTLVDADEPDVSVLLEKALRRDARASPEVEHRSRCQVARRARDLVLEAVVGRELAPYELEVRVGVEVELVAHTLTVPAPGRPTPARARAYPRPASRRSSPQIWLIAGLE